MKLVYATCVSEFMRLVYEICVYMKTCLEAPNPHSSLSSLLAASIVGSFSSILPVGVS